MAEREGYGDDQGTRVGSPDREGKQAGGSEGQRGPSTQPVSEGLEGSILNEKDAKGRGKLGGGSEATEGIHGASSERGEREKTSTTSADDEEERAGSEPMRGSEQQHVSGYGGEGGKPKKSSDQR
jgi:hypothetical protein